MTRWHAEVGGQQVRWEERTWLSSDDSGIGPGVTPARSPRGAGAGSLSLSRRPLGSPSLRPPRGACSSGGDPAGSNPFNAIWPENGSAPGPPVLKIAVDKLLVSALSMTGQLPWAGASASGHGARRHRRTCARPLAAPYLARVRNTVITSRSGLLWRQ
ncbi:hypothetical protein AAFF_G00352660 [Aldrovandia affinis]|uniref:Uncharacterized protein n=1 Tax=Aldrovandia affinis TaxID=143900 RepID=A0AAD7SJ42_9TELE|nr:hypothetical protein AAFF_G00352660 [Aldrovandia affinis]